MLSLFDNNISSIIYVDNGSSNFKQYRCALLEKRKSECIVEFIRNEKNMGLGYAHNQGIMKAKNNLSDAVLIMDHDSVLYTNFISNLAQALEDLSRTEKVAAVGPIYVNEKTGEKYPITKFIGPFIKRLKPLNKPEEASVLISSGTLIPIWVLDDVGLMNEELFVDYIDIDWSYRARSKGYRLYAIPSAVMNHQIGDKRTSFLGRMVSVHSPVRRYYLTRNSVYMLRCKYISVGYKVRELTFNILRVIFFSLHSKEKKKYIIYSYYGLLDGIRGRFGECSLLSNKHSFK